MIYKGEDQTGQFIIQLEPKDIKKVFDLGPIGPSGRFSDGYDDGLWPWDLSFSRTMSYARPELKEWLETHATAEDGMPLYSGYWDDAFYNKMIVHAFYLRFYRKEAASLFKLTWSE